MDSISHWLCAKSFKKKRLQVGLAGGGLGRAKGFIKSVHPCEFIFQRAIGHEVVVVAPDEPQTCFPRGTRSMIIRLTGQALCQLARCQGVVGRRLVCGE